MVQYKNQERTMCLQWFNRVYWIKSPDGITVHNFPFQYRLYKIVSFALWTVILRLLYQE